MPPVRMVGNLALSFLAKLSSGYWTIMDPTNGFFAIHARVAELLDGDRVAKRFFFETDLLIHLGLIRAKVVEFPMRASYGNEVSNLRVSRELGPFLAGHVRNTFRRILYRYFFRDLSLASLQLVAGTARYDMDVEVGDARPLSLVVGAAGSACSDRNHHDRGADIPDRIPARPVVSQLRHQFEPARALASVSRTRPADGVRSRRPRKGKPASNWERGADAGAAQRVTLRSDKTADSRTAAAFVSQA